MALRIYKSNEGYVWVAKDYKENELGEILYLGINDDIDNYEQIPKTTDKNENENK